MSEEKYNLILKAVLEGEDEEAARLVEDALEMGLPLRDILQKGIIAGIIRAGELWNANEYFLPDVVLATESFRAAMGVLGPRLKEGEGNAPTKKFVIGVVEGDVHDLGKDLVVAMLTSAGFDVIDLGINVPNAKFIETVKNEKPDILGMGTYMTTTMAVIEEIIEGLKEEGLRESVTLMVGGIPTSQEFCDRVGADAWGKDALTTVRRSLELVGGK